MKKALALLLALVLAFSMAVSAFGLVILDETETEESDKTEIALIDWEDDGWVLYTSQSTGMFSWFVGSYKYYVAVEAYDDDGIIVEFDEIKATSNGNLSAKFVDYDPEEMTIWTDATETEEYVKFGITKKGELLSELEADEINEYEAQFTDDDYTYEEALEIVDLLEDYEDKKVTYYDIEQLTSVYVLEITVAENYTTHYTTGTIEIEATADDTEYTGELTLVNDVSILEYEQVKWTAENYDDGEVIYVGEQGYSDYLTDLYGYDADWDTVLGQYDEHDLRYLWGGAVISTTAFRAIEGESLVVGAIGDFLTVEIDGVEADQKGVNFHPTLPYVVDKDGDSVLALDFDEENLVGNWITRNTEKAVAIGFGFKGDQVIKGDFTVTLDMGIDWYELRELFNIKVEEDDIITYYIVKDGKVIDDVTVDYMTDDVSADVVFSVELADTTLGEYEIRLDVPAVEGESEQNPNTGAESVVGVVAALAVVSLATAAAVSLKK